MSPRRGRAALRVTPVPGDATQLDLGRRFDLVLAPASFAQIVGGRGARQALLGVIARHLAATGVAVVAIADVDEILRECATPAPPQRLTRRRDGPSPPGSSPPPAVERWRAGVSWQRSPPRRARTTPPA